jgi:hypothetical protein
MASAVGGLMVLGFPAISSAQRASESPAQPVGRIAPVSPGSIRGVVTDERESRVAGAVVTALGSTAILALTDHDGRFELPGLTAGSYVVTARLKGYVAPPAQRVEIGSDARRISTLVLRRARTSVPLLVAGIGAGQPDPPAVADPASDGSSVDPPAAGDETPETDADHGETAWRLRHARPDVLKMSPCPTSLPGRRRPHEHLAGRVVAAPSLWRVSQPVSLPIRLLRSGEFLTTGS